MAMGDGHTSNSHTATMGLTQPRGMATGGRSHGHGDNGHMAMGDGHTVTGDRHTATRDGRALRRKPWSWSGLWLVRSPAVLTGAHTRGDDTAGEELSGQMPNDPGGDRRAAVVWEEGVAEAAAKRAALRPDRSCRAAVGEVRAPGLLCSFSFTSPFLVFLCRSLTRAAL